jgi:hypothetical protein
LKILEFVLLQIILHELSEMCEKFEIKIFYFEVVISKSNFHYYLDYNRNFGYFKKS